MTTPLPLKGRFVLYGPHSRYGSPSISLNQPMYPYRVRENGTACFHSIPIRSSDTMTEHWDSSIQHYHQRNHRLPLGQSQLAAHRPYLCDSLASFAKRRGDRSSDQSGHSEYPVPHPKARSGTESFWYRFMPADPSVADAGASP